jgi:hypothetical protein
VGGDGHTHHWAIKECSVQISDVQNNAAGEIKDPEVSRVGLDCAVHPETATAFAALLTGRLLHISHLFACLATGCCLITLFSSTILAENNAPDTVAINKATPDDSIQLLTKGKSGQAGVYVLHEKQNLGSAAIRAERGQDLTLRVVLGFNIDRPFFCRVDDRFPALSVKTPWVIESNGKVLFRYNKVQIYTYPNSMFLYFPRGASASPEVVREDHGIVTFVKVPLSSVPESISEVTVPIDIHISIYDTKSEKMHTLTDLRQQVIKLEKTSPE